MTLRITCRTAPHELDEAELKRLFAHATLGDDGPLRQIGRRDESDLLGDDDALCVNACCDKRVVTERHRLTVAAASFTGGCCGCLQRFDGSEVRAALRTFGSDRLPLRYLDGAGVPMRFKLRRVDGEPVPMHVLAEMERYPAEPWKVRDRMLNEMGWYSKGIPWAEGRRRRSTGFSKSRPPWEPGQYHGGNRAHGERKLGEERERHGCKFSEETAGER